MDPQLLKTYHSELLTPLFTEVLTVLEKKCTKNVVVAISYAWPILPEEDRLQEQVLRIADDLTGILKVKVEVDLLSLPLSSNFSRDLITCIRRCNVALLIGSPSYASRASDSSCITSSEVLELAAKKARDPEGVIPVLLAGGFQNSFPPGYTNIMGCDLRFPVTYMLNFPSLAAKLLGVHQEEDVKKLLTEYDQNTSNILKEAPLPDLDSVKERQLQSSRFWSSRVMVKISGFSHNQLLMLDGKIAKREKFIQAYCKQILSKEVPPLSLPDDLSLSSNHSPPPLPLEQRLCDFLKGTARVLLLQAPQGAGKSLMCKYLATLAWEKHQLIPIFITLDPTQQVPLHDHLVDDELASYGFDSVTIKQARESHNFLIIVEGFDSCKVQTNVYVRHKLQSWPGKLIFTCRTNYLANAPYAWYYFMPQTANHQADPSGLQVISFTTQYTNCAANSPEVCRVKEQVSLESLQVVQQNKAPTISVARERWRKAIKRVSANRRLQAVVIRYSSVMREGFLLLQRDIVGVVMYKFLDYIANLKVSSTAAEKPKSYCKAFISYAWPPVGPERIKLQSRLVQLVNDLKEASIDVTLDILRLRVGMNITNFMKDGISESKAVLWIGTPGLKARIRFRQDGTPDNPATEEFVHIQSKSHSNIHLLWFSGNQLENSYPSAEGLLQKFTDFRNEREYFQLLPLLAATILEVDSSPVFKTQYSLYLYEILAIERTFTETSIIKRLEQKSQETEQQQVITEAKIQQLLDDMPEHYRTQQIAADEALLQSLNARVLHAKSTALAPDTPHALALSMYIPLHGGHKPDSPEVNQFDISEKVKDFVASDGPMRLLLIQGSAGSGKSLYSRLLEKQLWKFDTKDNPTVIPLFVQLTHLANPFSNLAEAACKSVGFKEEDILLLKSSKRVIFILDGLDELSLDRFPADGIIASNRLLEWPLSKVIITTRIDFLASLETHLNCSSYRHHLTQGLTDMEELFLMPFNETQMKKYIQVYTTTEDSDWKDWRRYLNYLDSVIGLKELARNPFTLKLLLNVIPQFSTNSIVKLTKTAVYEAFAQHYLRKEMWKEVTRADIPLLEDRLARMGILAENLGHELFSKSTTRAAVSLDDADAKLLRGLPVQLFTDRTFSFIHKSLQEFLTARKWMKAINGSEQDRLQLLGAQLVSSEKGLIEFLVEYYHTNEHFEPLLAQVYSSRSFSQSSSHNIASANAMTILVAARSNLSMMDLSHVCVSGANLDGIIADSTNFAQANLSGASLRQAWLRNSDLQGANLTRVQLGQYFRMQGDKIEFVSVFRNKLLVIDSSGACLWDIESRIGEVLFRNHNLHGTWFAFSDEVVCVARGSHNSFQVWREPHGQLTTCNLVSSRTFQYLVHQGRIITVHDYEARVWDLNTCQQILPPLSHDKIILCVAGFKDRIAIGAGDRIYVWSLLDGQLLFCSPSLRKSFEHVVLVESKVITASYYTQIWDISNNQISEIELNSKCCCLTVEDGTVIFGCINGTLEVWDLTTCQQIGDTFVAHTDPVCFVALLSSKIVSASTSEIRTWEIPQSNFSATQSQVMNISAGGSKFAVWYTNNTIQVWEKKDRHFELNGTVQHTTPPACIAINDQWLVSNSKAELRLTSLTDWPTEIQLREDSMDPTYQYQASLVTVSPTLVATSISLSKESKQSPQKETLVRVWDFASKQQIFKLSEAKDTTCIQLAFCDELLLVGFSDGTIVFWQAKTNIKRKFRVPWPSRSLPVQPSISVRGTTIAVHTDHLKIWQFHESDGKLRPISPQMANLESNLIAFLGEHHVAYCPKLSTLRVWGIRENRRVCEVTLHSSVTALSSLNDNHLVVVSGTQAQCFKFLYERSELCLLFSTKCNWRLQMEGCKVQGISGLTPAQANLLKHST